MPCEARPCPTVRDRSQSYHFGSQPATEKTVANAHGPTDRPRTAPAHSVSTTAGRDGPTALLRCEPVHAVDAAAGFAVAVVQPGADVSRRVVSGAPDGCGREQTTTTDHQR